MPTTNTSLGLFFSLLSDKACSLGDDTMVAWDHCFSHQMFLWSYIGTRHDSGSPLSLFSANIAPLLDHHFCTFEARDKCRNYFLHFKENPKPVECSLDSCFPLRRLCLVHETSRGLPQLIGRLQLWELFVKILLPTLTTWKIWRVRYVFFFPPCQWLC